ncbi:MAG: hypothetical protein KGO81_01175 [Bacteroidota bacterium]|nr:hypothetical protein [Bacteroidota bacterium]
MKSSTNIFETPISILSIASLVKEEAKNILTFFDDTSCIVVGSGFTALPQ